MSINFANILTSAISTVLVGALSLLVSKVIKEVKALSSERVDTKGAIDGINEAMRALSDKVDGVSGRMSEMSDELRSEETKRAEHDRMDDSASVFTMRDHLLSEHERLVSKGWAGYEDRSAWHEAYDVYDRLVQASGQSNGVMGDYAEDIDELPMQEPAA